MDWRNVKTSFLERRSYLMQTGMWTDCFFRIGPQRLKFSGHKLLLCMASPVFESHLVNSNSDVVFNDLDPDAFKKILQFIYTDGVDIGNYKEAYLLHFASRKLVMLNLERISAKKIEEFVSPATACHLLEYSLSIECEQLTNIALKIITERTLEVIASPNFIVIQSTTLEEILKIDDLNVNSEQDLIDGFLRWATENIHGPLGPQSLREVAGGAVEQLRFLTLTPRQLAEGPANSPLLTEAECLTFFKLVSQPGPVSIPVPQGLSTNRRPRRHPGPRN